MKTIFHPFTRFLKKCFHKREKFEHLKNDATITISEPKKEKTKITEHLKNDATIPEPKKERTKITNGMHVTFKQEQELPPTIEVQELSFFEIQKKTNNFDKSFLIRKGSHAEIYNFVLEDKQVVIKKLHNPSKHFSNAEFLKQVSIASRLKHENYIELLGYCLHGENRLLAYEFSQIGSLHDVLHGARGGEGSRPRIVLTWQQRVRIALESAKGLEFLHVGACITHKDIRSSNILLFWDCRAKINDYNIFNQAPEMNERLNSTMALGTFGYHAPEYAVSGFMTPQSDVYSFGVVLLELLTGRKPVDMTLPRERQSLVRWATPLLEKNIISNNIEQCVDPRLNGRWYLIRSAMRLGRIARDCLQYEADLRPVIGEVVRMLEILSNSSAPN